MTLRLTPLQIATECARLCIAEAREELPSEAWPYFVDALAALVANEGRKVLIREMRKADQWR
jgi:hypothetical protein